MSVRRLGKERSSRRRVGPSTYAELVAAAKPTTWFRLDETSGSTAVDSGSGGHNATFVGSGSPGSVPTIYPNVLDAAKCTNFAGSAWATTSAFGTPATALTAEVFILPLGLAANQMIFTHMDIGAAFGSSYAWYITIPSGNATGLSGGIISGTTPREASVASGALANGGRYLVSLCADATSTLLYVNGAQVASTSGGVPNSGSGIPVGIAKAWQSGSPSGTTFNGVIQSAAIFDTKHSPADILLRAQALGLVA